MSKLYGFSSLSLFAILILAVLKPVALGLNVILKVVKEPPAIGVDGIAVIVKSAKCVPVILTYGDPPVKVIGAGPVFLIVKVLVLAPPVILAEPKSV